MHVLPFRRKGRKGRLSDTAIVIAPACGKKGASTTGAPFLMMIFPSSLDRSENRRHSFTYAKAAAPFPGAAAPLRMETDDGQGVTSLIAR